MVEVTWILLLLTLLLKFLSTSKMMIMLMSLEMISVFIFMVFIHSLSSGVSTGLISLLLVMFICEGVMALLLMVNLYRSGSRMISSISILWF